MNIWDESQIICTWHFKSNLSLRKRPTFCNSTTSFPTKWLLRKDCRNSILMMCQGYVPDLHVLPDWLKICFNYSGALPRSAVAHPNHQYGISMLIPQISFQGVTLLVASWNVISKKLTMMQCYCATPSTLDLKPFLEHQSRTDALKLHPNQYYPPFLPWRPW